MKKPWWYHDLKTHDSAWWALYSVLVLWIWIPCKIFTLCYGAVHAIAASVVCAPFTWHFDRYLDSMEERQKYSRWWRDCTQGGWLVYRGPFGIELIRRSACR